MNPEHVIVLLAHVQSLSSNMDELIRLVEGRNVLFSHEVLEMQRLLQLQQKQLEEMASSSVSVDNVVQQLEGMINVCDDDISGE